MQKSDSAFPQHRFSLIRLSLSLYLLFCCTLNHNMAIFHADVKLISRSDGRNSVACAAYRSGEKLYDESLHRTFDYRRRESVYASEILAPDDAPEWVHQRSWLWNEVERVENAHNRRNSAQLAREVMVALPTELSHPQKQELVRSYVRNQFTRHGMVADIGYHDFDTQNPHAHIMLTLRRIEPKGFGKKERDWNNQALVSEWRQQWAIHANNALEQAGHSTRIDHRSHKDRGVDQIPLVHLGASVWGLEKDGLRQGKPAVTELGEQYQAIQVANDNRQRRQQEITRLEQEAAELRAAERTQDVLQPLLKDSQTTPTQSAQPAALDAPPVTDLSPAAQEKAIAAFSSIYLHYANRTRHHKSPSDMDFAVCKIMAKRGWSDDHIAYGCRHASPDLEQRKPGREWAYVWRTVRNAAKQPDVQAARAQAVPSPTVGDVSLSRSGRAPLTPQQQYQSRWNAVQAAFRRPDASTYIGNAVREYRKELARQQLTQGFNPADLTNEARQTIDRDIALRLLAAGYSRREVANAIQRCSPEAAMQPPDYPYGEWLVIQATQSQTVRQTVRDYQRWKVEQQHAPQERRLDRLGLATTRDQHPQIPPRLQVRDIEPER